MKLNPLAVLSVVLISALVIGCAPSEAEIRGMVLAEIAKVEIPAGPAGPQGERGERGIVGPRGGPGVVGLQGEPGPQGEQGIAGPQGERGEQGPQGEQGIAGPQGGRGEQGPQGEQGIAGPQGERGEQGTAGLRGEQGIAGPQGERGEQGPKGDSGDLPEFPTSIELEKLTLRSPDGNSHIIIRSGRGDNIAHIRWYDSETEDLVGEVIAGASDGMVLRSKDRNGRWTEICIDADRIFNCNR